MRPSEGCELSFDFPEGQADEVVPQITETQEEVGMH